MPTSTGINTKSKLSIAYLTVYLDENILKRAVNEWTTRSKISMAGGCLILERSQEENEDYIFISATHCEQRVGILKEILAKVCHISEDEGRRTSEVTSKHNHQDPDSSLSRKFGRNNRMLWYKRFNTYFFSDDFWVTKIAKSIHGFTCMRLFVSEKVFVKLYVMIYEK